MASEPEDQLVWKRYDIPDEDIGLPIVYKMTIHTTVAEAERLGLFDWMETEDEQ